MEAVTHHVERDEVNLNDELQDLCTSISISEARTCSQFTIFYDKAR